MKHAYLIILSILIFNITVAAQDPEPTGYILEIEKDIAQFDSLNFGGGIGVGYSFFNDVEGFNYVFRKRVLKPGASIRYHLQNEDEVYYILNGTGEMQMNDRSFPVEAGSCILTRSGSSHGLSQTGENDLELIIVYEKE